MKVLSKVMLILMIFLTAYSLQPKAAHAEIPHLINYQGKLVDSDGTPITGTKNITFKIYNVSSGGTPLWQETQSVTADRGLFNVLLGSNTTLSLPFDVPYYLGIQVAGDTEMSPRAKIGAAGYAFRAEQSQNANAVNDIRASTSPEANKLLPLDSSGKFPLTAIGLKTYDSGWFAISDSKSYSKTHNLGTTKLLVQVYISENPDGSGRCTLAMPRVEQVNGQCTVESLSATSISIRTSGAVVDFRDTSGRWYTPSAYARIVILALE